MYMLVAIRDGAKIEWVPDFATRRDAEQEARRLNALPTYWRSPDGRLYHRPYWKVEVQRQRGPSSCAMKTPSRTGL
jgi:hypothetical protein